MLKTPTLKFQTMKSTLIVSILLVFSFYMIGCEDDDPQNNTIIGTGPVMTENLDLDFFNQIELTGVANFYITIGSPQAVVLKAQQNIIDVMTWEVSGQTLQVGLQEGVSIENHEEIRFEITMSEINLIELIGVGNFVLSGDDQDELDIYLTGVGNINAFDMKVGSCNITSTGVGNCEVYVINNLTVTITGVGDVYYKGSPTINSNITGLGNLINAN